MRTAGRTVLCILVLSGCSVYRVDSEGTSSDFFLPRESAEKILYFEKLDKPGVTVGLVRVTTERISPRAEVLARMRYEAAILGADALTGLVEERAPLHVQYTARAVAFK